MRTRSVLALALLALCSLSTALADVYPIDNTTIRSAEPKIFRVQPMYNNDDSPSLIVDKNGEGSNVKLNMTFNAVAPAAAIGSSNLPAAGTRVQVLIYQSTTLSELGYESDYSIAYCCTESLASTMTDNPIPGCSDASQYNSLIVQPSAKGVQSFYATYDGSSSSASIIGTYDVTVTGELLMLVSNCDTRLLDDVTVSGSTIWHNQSGYLTGALYGFLPFYVGLLSAYCLLASIWLFLYVKHFQYLITVQQFITFILVWSIAENAMQFLDYSIANKTGVRNIYVVISAIVLTTLRLTVSRILVVMVALGYASTSRALAASSIWKMALLGILYFAAETALELVERQAAVSDQAGRIRLYLALPVAFFNACFYVWIFSGLNATTEYLTQNQQIAKLKVYRKFAAVLVTCLVLSVAFVLYDLYYLATLQALVHWSYLWILNGGFSTILYTVILYAIMLLWRPSRVAKSLGYDELVSQPLDEFDALELQDVDNVTPNGSYSTNKQQPTVANMDRSSNGNGRNGHHLGNEPQFTISDDD